MENILGTIPEFTSDATVQPEAEHIPEEVNQPETETPVLPAEKPADEVVSDEHLEPSQEEKDKAIQGLQNERVKLLKEISELKGTKREIKQDQINSVQAQIDELKDLHPDDIAVIDRVLRAKGYMTKEESNKMYYESVKNEELNKFLDKYPEYKPENDPDDVNWGTLQKELGFYRMPENPRLLTEVLERAHRGVVKVPSGSTQAKIQQVRTASVGSGGVQRATSSNKLDPEKRAMLQGFSDEDIHNIESKL